MKGWVIGIVAMVVAGGWFITNRGKKTEPDIEYRYAKVEKDELVRSISATGTLVALTSVDVKSKAGGRVVRLLVEEGSRVKQGETIAIIDPADTEATYQQAEADLSSAQARANQARVNYELAVTTNRTTIADAEASLSAAQTRLARIRLEAGRQPALTRSSLQNAEAALESARQNLARVRNVDNPQRRREAQGAFASAETALRVAESDLTRQQDLFAKGYVSQSTVDRARQTVENARTAFETAKQRQSTLEQDLTVALRSAELQVQQAEAAYSQSKANSSQDQIAQKNLAEAENAVKQAQIALQKAKDDARTLEVRKSDITAAQASTVRSRVALGNAKVQLDSTTVIAPRDGVVTLKYLEEGTIIPPGTSTFAQGTSLVQLSDISKMYVECAVDEADIGSVAVGQKVRIVTEAYPGERFDGKVVRVNPAAVTESNITAVKVRVEILPTKVRILPGMTATCEFITLNKPDVILIPGQAVETVDGKSFVKVKSANALRPERREVKLGETGNNGVEVVSGLSVGEEIVTAEIDLAAMRETQAKMLEAQQGGGLAGGPMGGQRRPAGGGGGGARASGGGGGGGGR